MSAIVRYTMQGLEGATRMLEGVSDKLQRSILVKVMQKAGAPIANSARAKVRPVSKRVAKAIKVWDFKKSKTPNVFVGTRYSKDTQKDPWFAHMIEGGTKGVKQNRVHRSKALQSDPENIRVRSIVKQTGQGKAYRRDMPSRPFMQPAINENQSKMVNIMTNEYGAIIEKELKKYGK